jgi:F0F1-type ATP synthase membrane subunit b/b'
MDRIWANLNLFTQAAIVLISLSGIAFHIRWSRRGVALGPTLLTTMGIFFCFAGIAWGLLDFDPGDIKASVPHLLQGIRTSFWASVAGIGFALTIKIRYMLFGDAVAPAGQAETGASIDDLSEHLARLNRRVSRGEESSVVDEINQLRADANQGFSRLTASFEKYAEKVAESNSKALINALQEVIRDFNAKINEQFGENFKQLNTAVGRLLEWQVQYEVQLNSLIQQETATRKSMSEAALRYTELVGKSTIFSSVAQSLHGLLSNLESQRSHLETALVGFAGLIDKASNGLPEIEHRIVEMTRQIESGVRGNQDVLSAAMADSAQSLQEQQRQLTHLVTATMETANQTLNAHLRQATEDSRKHIGMLDRALEEELRKSIESLGRQLTALSQKFVQDYTPLTAQLQRVVQLGRS